MVTKFASSSSSSSSSLPYLKKPIVLAMYSTSSATSSQSYYKLSWLHTFLLLLLSPVFHMTSVSSSATPISYTDHCDSIVPESTPTSLDFTTSPFPGSQSAYYIGRDTIFNRNSPYNSSNLLKTLWLHTQKVYKTDVESIFKVKGSLIFQNLNTYRFAQNYTNGHSYDRRSWLGSLSFELQGFWSQSSGKLCMVGSSSAAFSKEGLLLHLGAVFKLNSVKNSSIFTSLVTGTLESLSSVNDSSYFEPISIFVIPPTNYNYTLVSQEFANGCSGGSDIPRSLPLSSQWQKSLCSILSRPLNGLELKYTSDCGSAKNCSPFGGSIEYLPRIMSLNVIQCSRDTQMLRVLLKFSDKTRFGYEQSFSPNATLIGEGLWDGKKNQLCVVACRILNTTGFLANAHVGDCSIRLSLRFPAIWSIRDTSSIVGQIWSNKTVNDSGYFDRIIYRSSEIYMMGAPGLKYEYTEIDRVQKSCSVKKPVKNKGTRYPNGVSNAMRFDISVKNSKGKSIAWGFLEPLSVGDLFYAHQLYPIDSSTKQPTNSAVQATSGNSGPMNISYKISFRILPGEKLGGGISPFNISLGPNMLDEISAEGIYDAKTGGLCMVGCRNIVSNNWTSTNDSMDCEILVKFQFPPSNSKKNGGYIKGSIESTRKKSDSLYFDRLDLSSTSVLPGIARQSIWKMDFEITMVLISKTLACVFVGLQLFYVKKNPDMLPFTSVIMLGILTLGYMIPLVLNFEAVFLQNRSKQIFLLRSSGWIQMDEVTIRVVTMLAFLLQFRLLHLTWSARSGDESQKNLWAAEKKALYVSLPLYAAGGLIACFVSWIEFNMGYSQNSLWRTLKSYGGLVLDGFLLPQILLNILGNLREKSLSNAFYIGTTFVHLVPHAYDLYRAHIYASRSVGSYFYADSGADFYSPAWDVVIPCGGLLFASVIYLQQRFGGRCILPRRLWLLEEYEKVPVVNNA